MDVLLRSISICTGLAATLAALSLGPAHAVPMTASEPAAMFGDLAQGATKCPAANCGPTAAINSFVFLQKMYTKVYGDKLIGNAGMQPTKAELIAAANNLACNFTQNCTANRSAGTFIGDFILGKQDYINTISGGALNDSTTFAAQISQTWGDAIDPNHKQAKPGYVTDDKKPTWNFVLNQIKHEEDVEVEIAFPGGAHYLTLTGISFDPATKKGTLSVIDPFTGMATANPLPLVLETGAKKKNPLTGFLAVNYRSMLSSVVGAVAESPKNPKQAVPEPTAAALLIAGLAGLLAVRRQRRPHG